ncbi:hypothetical protein F4811DRAFT_555085 [Daldinia bambusicola]|nr:hypothetical protein F4811DRAFT_555085 [Daldinia bambusicola]
MRFYFQPHNISQMFLVSPGVACCICCAWQNLSSSSHGNPGFIPLGDPLGDGPLVDEGVPGSRARSLHVSLNDATGIPQAKQTGRDTFQLARSYMGYPPAKISSLVRLGQTVLRLRWNSTLRQPTLSTCP